MYPSTRIVCRTWIRSMNTPAVSESMAVFLPRARSRSFNSDSFARRTWRRSSPGLIHPLVPRGVDLDNDGLLLGAVERPRDQGPELVQEPLPFLGTQVEEDRDPVAEEESETRPTDSKGERHVSQELFPGEGP
jgi:hypothetical protein